MINEEYSIIGQKPNKQTDVTSPECKYHAHQYPAPRTLGINHNEHIAIETID